MKRPAFLSDPSLVRIWDALPDARVVGGAVRDALADRPVADIDLAIPLVPDAVVTALTNAGVKVVPTGLTHGTVTAVANGRGFEVTTLRRDVETDGRHAVVAFTADWQQDASRRDFTINAMSMTRDGTVFDYFGGRDDLQAGRVRFVGDPATRITEDYLRILRFFRFYARFGRSPPDAATLTALKSHLRSLGRLPVERVWNELRRILATSEPLPAVTLMDNLGFWQAVMPEAAAIARLRDIPAEPVLRLAAMLTDDPRALALRLKLSSDDRDRLSRLMATPAATGPDDALRRLLAEHELADLVDRTWLDGDPDARQRLFGMKRPAFPLKGRDVVALGLPSGPLVGALLRTVRQWWLDGGCHAGRTECLEELARIAHPSNMNVKR